MVTDLMPPREDHIHVTRMLFDLSSHEEKRCLRTVSIEDRKYFVGIRRIGTVVERKRKVPSVVRRTHHDARGYQIHNL